MPSLEREVVMEMLKLEEERRHISFLLAKRKLSEERRAMLGMRLETLTQELARMAETGGES